MKLTRDIQSLSVFKRDTAKFMRQLKKTKEPIILTVNGKAEMVLLDAESYDYFAKKISGKQSKVFEEEWKM